MISPELPKKWSRALILAVRPSVDGGRFPIKRITGEAVAVSADIVADGHETVAAEVLFGPKGAPKSAEEAVRLKHVGNDVYEGCFTASGVGMMRYRVRAWVDMFATWQAIFKRRVDAGSDEAELRSELLEGAALLQKAARKAKGEDKRALQAFIGRFEAGEHGAALEPEVTRLASVYDPREGAAESEPLEILVERPLAQFSSWYEFFPRSFGPDGAHGTLDDAARHLDYVKEMGFDIVYLPPIHPIGRSFRKGKDNSPTAGPGEPGSPWAIGSEEGGHKAVHPELGGLEAFDRFMARAKELGLEVALDLAYQCSPDHPYVKEHPDWFRQRPDGSIRYAENPPKKYQDIYPIDFESADWKNLWQELRSVVAFWAERGVRTFRVDNPHTKALPFWGWCFASLRQDYPDLIFLSEAFTRPKQMYALAKLGFSQSYTYFTWRYSKWDFEEYLTELFHTEVAEFYRPSFWPNTPDILPPYLRSRASFQARLVMAATMSSSYGLYGPAFELMDNEPHELREENKNNEKYELKRWNLEDPNSLKPLITRVNAIRAENPALHGNRSLRFHRLENDQLLAYSKREGDNRILVVVNLDDQHTQAGFVELDLGALELSEHEPFVAHDLLTDERYTWEGRRNFVQLDPHHLPAHILRLSPRGDDDYAARGRAV
ncbi:alpha-1,4-glucan--maltose-1-phosphate maltosyltransferase [Truepera radiovictrix]|uniref:Alpha-1,4-glucan:maltose-1-phosphate maltosyltransferase n=1 Tax=Truepera radiovictrix (strain DSM 17093 / CIP 108686 / LMG 22925 / RQ-24) TaxID=649638 RepID=D7CX35_TRURR|nr:alpha-1,4-glucan--maltose-1-phosphate maltosyltransferase [Truepera radiovictrix]ADI14543.1 alpha amylase catalytic region [Truepera radiovictrix DSM 17093]WMT56906.1 alpha-1,4-glucan--maltose-1-phosphate maltosyltransferase [Truepera radiovictrix]